MAEQSNTPHVVAAGIAAAPAADSLLQATLRYYSGRSSPSWPLSAIKSTELLRLLSAAKDAQPSAVTLQWVVDGQLGYSGFSVQGPLLVANVKYDWLFCWAKFAVLYLSPTAAAVSGAATKPRLLVDVGQTIEKWVLASAPLMTDALFKSMPYDAARTTLAPSEVVNITTAMAFPPAPPSDLQPHLPVAGTTTFNGAALTNAGGGSDELHHKDKEQLLAPPYSLSWNDFGDIMEYNNCYNYANNQRLLNFAQPGRTHPPQAPWPFHANEVIQAAIRDGLVWLGAAPMPQQVLPATMQNVALALMPLTPADVARYGAGAMDYHWWRQDDAASLGNHWSHKPGETRARAVDSRHQMIADPSYAASRGAYTEWVGFFLSDRARVNISG